MKGHPKHHCCDSATKEHAMECVNYERSPSHTPDPVVGTYANSAFGALTPRDGDVVEWISTGERWTVSRQDDLEGPSALKHWPDGGWCNVRLVSRPNGKAEALAGSEE